MICKMPELDNRLQYSLNSTVCLLLCKLSLPSIWHAAYPPAHFFAGLDQDHNAFAQTRDRPINPGAPDINNAPSLGQLYEQPIGLAYITSAPCFEINGPIRFKRSVSGNRYKPPAGDLGTGWMNSPQGLGNGLDISRHPNASPSPSKLHQMQAASLAFIGYEQVK